MLPEAQINIVLQTFSGIISLMMQVFLSVVRSEQSKLDKLYIRFLRANTLVQFLNVASWYFHGRPGAYIHALLVVVDFLIFAVHYLILGFLTDYLVAFLEKNNANCKNVSRIVWAIAVFGIALVVVAQFNGMHYTIDAQNGYERGWANPLFMVIGILGVMIDLCMFFYHHKKLQPREYYVFIACMFFLIVSLAVQAAVLGAVYLYISLTFFAVCIYIFIQVEERSCMNEQTLELERSRTQLMLSQVQPHFLFNALIGIKALCDLDPQKASAALEHFSYYLRCNLESLSTTDLIPFEREISHVEDYLYLEKIRFEEKLQIVWELHCTGFLLPSLTIQPIVENAVRHGITEKKDGGTLTIRSEDLGDEIVITITDDGVGFDMDEVHEDGFTHIGIDNVRKRLAVQCAGTLTIDSRRGAGTTARITLPEKGVKLHEDYSSR